MPAEAVCSQVPAARAAQALRSCGHPDEPQSANFMLLASLGCKISTRRLHRNRGTIKDVEKEAANWKLTFAQLGNNRRAIWRQAELQSAVP